MNKKKMEKKLTAYGSNTWSRTPIWALIHDDNYYYSDPIYLERGHIDIGYFSSAFNTEQEVLNYITLNNLIRLDETPPYREDKGDLDWFDGEILSRGNIRIYNEIKYLCKQPHTSEENFTPDMLPALWEVIPDTNEWMEQVWYSFDCVYEGIEYEIIQPHLSQVGYEPPNVPALWEVKEIPEIPVTVILWEQPQPGIDEPFMKDDIVEYNGQHWVSKFDDNWWVPGQYGWEVIPEIIGDLCDTTAEWSSGGYIQYNADFNAGLDVYVKYNNSIWQAKNTTHTWIAPALSGDGAISWNFVKDCI